MDAGIKILVYLYEELIAYHKMVDLQKLQLKKKQNMLFIVGRYVSKFQNLLEYF